MTELYLLSISPGHYISKIEDFLEKFNNADAGEYVYYDRDERVLLENIDVLSEYSGEIISRLKWLDENTMIERLVSWYLYKYLLLDEVKFPKSQQVSSWAEIPHFSALQKDISVKMREVLKQGWAFDGCSIVDSFNVALYNSNFWEKWKEEILNNTGKAVLVQSIPGNECREVVFAMIRELKSGFIANSFVPLDCFTSGYWNTGERASYDIFAQICVLTNIDDFYND